MQETAPEPTQEPDLEAEPRPEVEEKEVEEKVEERVEEKVEEVEEEKVEAKEEKKEEEKKQAKPRKRAPVRARDSEPATPIRKNRRNATKAYDLPDELSARPGKSSLRIVSANLRNGQVDPVALAELIHALRADIVAIQEAGRVHFEALAPQLPHGEFETAPRETGLGIALRRPATPGRIKVAWRGARLMSLDPTDWPELQQPLDIVNVHIAPPHYYKPPLYGFVLRNQQVRALENHFGSPPYEDPASGAPQSRSSVLIGDFNATPLWPVYRRIASQFTDAAIAVAQVEGRSAEPTWSLPAGTPRRLRLDHAFVRGVTPEEFQAVRIAGSDHSAIVVDITDRTNRSSS